MVSKPISVVNTHLFDASDLSECLKVHILIDIFCFCSSPVALETSIYTYFVLSIPMFLGTGRSRHIAWVFCGLIVSVYFFYTFNNDILKWVVLLAWPHQRPVASLSLLTATHDNDLGRSCQTGTYLSLSWRVLPNSSLLWLSSAISTSRLKASLSLSL